MKHHESMCLPTKLPETRFPSPSISSKLRGLRGLVLLLVHVLELAFGPHGELRLARRVPRVDVLGADVVVVPADVVELHGVRLQALLLALFRHDLEKQR